ncbi:MAG: EF2563 family selenium-dependent molybdenum hydroxylase system protein [bacterium]|nr:EF2563 family selenium-dependent molybdenum hydroxylase system protein [bacterium]
MSNQGSLIWIQGAGELASGVALRLIRSNYRVIMAEISNPLAVRRQVCFSEAVFDGNTEVEGVQGRLCQKIENNLKGVIQVVVDPMGEMIVDVSPAALIDARMTKKAPQPLAKVLPFIVGLGPGFQCGVNADRIIETHRGARLGEVISAGQAFPNTGTPGVVGGQASRRVIYSPCKGKMISIVKIGDQVIEGQCLGHVAGEEVFSRLTGCLRGLVHPKAELSAGEKVADVDPRGSEVNPALATDKALAIGGGVLEALLGAGILPDS